MSEERKIAELGGQVAVKLNEISSMFQNPALTLVVRADNLPNGNYIMTRDNISNPINILRDFRRQSQKQMLVIDDLVDLHKDLSDLQQFIGNILPEEVSVEELGQIEVVQKIIEVMVKIMKKNAIGHQFQ